MSGPRILVIDGYPKRVREKLVEDGANVAADIYTATLKACRPDVICETLFAADPNPALQTGDKLSDFDGAVWTGSVVSVTAMDDPSVRQQVDFARAVFAAGVPSFGSCFAIQIATVAAGGTVVRNPKGREVGIGRGLRLTDAGRAHSVFAGRRPIFEAAMIHEDMVATLPPGGIVLVENDMAPIQAATFPTGQSDFTGVQYHPEFHAAELGAILWRQRKALIREGFYPDFAAVRTIADDMIALHKTPSRIDLRQKTGITDDLLDETIRLTEVNNWIHSLSRHA
jgi:GMP synthase (glutamine-hydrolysing)